jgi:hypothetical protein
MKLNDPVYAPAALLSIEKPQYPLLRPSGPQSRSGFFGEEKNLLPLFGIEFLACTVYSVIDISADMLRLPIFL